MIRFLFIAATVSAALFRMRTANAVRSAFFCADNVDDSRRYDCRGDGNNDNIFHNLIDLLGS